MGHRRTEQCHHRVADELLNRAAMALQDAAQAVVEGHQEGTHVLGVELLCASGEPDQISEHDRHHLALLATYKGGDDERPPTCVAEPRTVPILLTALSTIRHPSKSMTLVLTRRG